ncbi:hypothetical protein Agub_g706 [Astrephomene gubernaculifera]|uniref:Nucleotide-diphospho-sugar transferase domain-containing protein n=1 Tax=Astrephomene gubernaculifera TaxID=47775 RepID=A0AAD3DE75_9CHLO|nr:hypothetical protein Agub_g706 [Astrephomene gubernaculifera]
MHHILLAISLAILSSLPTRGGELQSSPSGPSTPWLQPASWVPADAEKVNDLEALLKARASADRWVTVFCFSVPEKPVGSAEEESFMRLALNTLYSYRTFGQATFDIVAAISPAALLKCQTFKLPCFNASHYAANARTLRTISWAKEKLGRDVLKLGYNLHISDLDVTYLKPIPLAIKEVFSWSNGAADGSMMQEEVVLDNPQDPGSRRPLFIANAGVMFLRATNRSVAFLESLLRWESEVDMVQRIAADVAYQSWAPCSEESTCLSAQRQGLAAITMHPTQFAHSNCQPETCYHPCASRRLYAHAICRGAYTEKEAFLRSLHLMFIRNSSYTGGGGGVTGGGVGASGEVGLLDDVELAASRLPCPDKQQRAWRARFYSAYTTEKVQQGAGQVTGGGGHQCRWQWVSGGRCYC